MGVILLGKIKIHEIAKKLGLTSKEVVDMAKELKIEVKSHLSGVTEEEAENIEKKLLEKSNNESVNKKEVNVEDKKKSKTENKKEAKVESKKEVKKETKKEEKAPVIIRREVIVAEEQPKKE